MSTKHGPHINQQPNNQTPINQRNNQPTDSNIHYEKPFKNNKIKKPIKQLRTGQNNQSQNKSMDNRQPTNQPINQSPKNPIYSYP